MTSTAARPFAPGPASRHRLERFEVDLVDSIADAPPRVRDVITPFLRSGGKRLRPWLVFLAGSFGKPAEEHLRRLAVVGELVHTASLLHDDVIDRSETRRNRPTLHHTHGPNVAVFAGAYLVHTANEIIHHLPPMSEETHRLVRECVSETSMALCTGQLGEVMNIGNLALEQDEYLATIDRKTGSLFQASCRLGSLVTEGPTQVLSGYGRRFGRLYQVLDDLRDVLGSKDEIGKLPGSDLREGTYTLPVIICLQGDDDESRLLRKSLENRRGKLEPRELEEVVAIVRRSVAIERTAEVAAGLGRDALDALELLPEGEACEELRGLVEHLLSQVAALVARARESQT